MVSVSAASPSTVARQPNAPIAQASGAELMIFPSDPSPTIIAASEANAAGE